MSNIRHILIATDGSELSLKAAEFGGELARACAARVSIVIVHEEQTVIPESWKQVGLTHKDKSKIVSTEDIRRRIEHRALADELPNTAAAVGELSSPPTQINLWGDPAEEICRYVKNQNVDMVVIGSHGRSGIKKAILGSVSHAVANAGPCPVTIVR